jgi:hypothetical protein
MPWALIEKKKKKKKKKKKQWGTHEAKNVFRPIFCPFFFYKESAGTAFHCMLPQNRNVGCLYHVMW